MQKDLFFVLLLLCIGYHNYGQDTLQVKTYQQEKKLAAPFPPPPPRTEVEEIFNVVERMPHFPGCEVVEGEEAKRQCSKEKLREFIQQNLEYPKEARRNNISGKVLIQFIVQADGRSTGIEVLEGLGYGCNEEAIRVLKLLEEQHIWWSPRGSRGRPIRILYKVPVHFKLLY